MARVFLRMTKYRMHRMKFTVTASANSAAFMTICARLLLFVQTAHVLKNRAFSMAMYSSSIPPLCRGRGKSAWSVGTAL